MTVCIVKTDIFFPFCCACNFRIWGFNYTRSYCTIHIALDLSFPCHSPYSFVQRLLVLWCPLLLYAHYLSLLVQIISCVLKSSRKVSDCWWYGPTTIERKRGKRHTKSTRKLGREWERERERELERERQLSDTKLPITASEPRHRHWGLWLHQTKPNPDLSDVVV